MDPGRIAILILTIALLIGGLVSAVAAIVLARDLRADRVGGLGRTMTRQRTRQVSMLAGFGGGAPLVAVLLFIWFFA